MNDQPKEWGSAPDSLPETWNQTGNTALPNAWGTKADAPELWSNPAAIPQPVPERKTQQKHLPEAAASNPVSDAETHIAEGTPTSAISEGMHLEAQAEPTAAPSWVPQFTVASARMPESDSLPPTLRDPYEQTDRPSSKASALIFVIPAVAVLAGGAVLLIFSLRGRNSSKPNQPQNTAPSEQVAEIVSSEDDTDNSQIIEDAPSSNPESQANFSTSELSEAELIEQTQIHSDASISEAKIVGKYNDFGAGYMFRLDLKGDYCYWTAEITEVQSDGQAYYSMVSSYELSDDDPYILGGSLTDQLSAEIIPFDEQDHPGTKYRVTWNGEEELTISPEYNPYLFTGYVATKKSDLSLRSYPNTDSAVLSKIPKDTKLDLYQSVCDGWYITCYRNKWGFVSGEYISETLGENSPGSQTAESWKDAYIEWLQYYAYGEGRTHYSLIDFDQNGIPELVAADKSSDVFVYDCPVVYTYANGGMIEVYQDLESGDFGEHQGWWNIYSSSLCANKKSGYYYNDYEGQQIFFRYKNNRLVLEAVFNIWQTGYDNQYIYNGYAVTEDEYNEHLQKYRNIINNGFKVKYEYDISNVKPIRDY